MLEYKEYLPSKPLKSYVDCYWHYQVDKDFMMEQQFHTCVPLGSIEIIVQINHRPCQIMNASGVFENSRNIYLTGLYTRTAFWKASGDTQMFGIRLKVESLIELFSLPVRLFNNMVVDAEHLLGSSARRMSEEMAGQTDANELIKIAEKYLLARLWNLNDRYNHAVGACRLIRDLQGHLSVESLSEKMHVSKRQLERAFKEYIGESPKTYQRIIRFRNAYTQVQAMGRTGKSWTEISYSSGYSDQAHFIRDFKSFSGKAPSSVCADAANYFQTLESTAPLIQSLQYYL